MVQVRRNVWSLTQPWDPDLLWYARGVKVMKSRAFADTTSWRYLAAIHGIEEIVWREFGWLAAGEKLPQTSAFRTQDRNQCQHHGWYFLPWHRGYLAAFEAIVRDAIKSLPGAPANWALPYWNYNDSKVENPRRLPEAFTKDTWPDGANNPLFEPRRYGTGSGTVVIRNQDVNLRPALTDPDFDGMLNGSPGFGGVETPFQHNADRNHEGWLEQNPHDTVHGQVGGSRAGRNPNDWRNYGLMSMPETAALDPIFWLHHANIDRLWEVWLHRNAGFKNPTAGSWLNAPSGARKFVVPQPGGTRKQFTPKDVLDTKAPWLNYTYEDTSDPLGGQQRLSRRLESLEPFVGASPVADDMKVAAMAERKVELLGANAQKVTLSSGPTLTAVRMDAPTMKRFADSFKRSTFAARALPEPDRVFLNLENITGENDAAIFDVYVGLQEGADPKQHPENLAGVVSLFGVRSATRMDNPHGGPGLSKVLEITEALDRLHLSGTVDLTTLPVLFVPVNDIGDGISIKRVSIYRQST